MKFVPGVDIDEVGIIYGNVGTSSFDCSAVAPLETMEYVQMKHDTCGWVLGQVDKITRKTNLSVDKARLISKGQSVDFDEVIIASVSVIGYRDERGLLQTPRTPFRAGESVYRASEELIKRVIGLKEDTEKGAYIGLLHGHDIRVYLDINTLVQKHVSVLAKTGGGKSYVTGDLIEEFIKHGVTTLIFDPHGEYSSLAKKGKVHPSEERFGVEPRDYGDKLLLFSPDTKVNRGARPLQFTLRNITARELLAMTSIKNAKTYLTPLRKALDLLQSSDKETYTLRDVIKVLESDEDSALGSLIGELEYLQETNIFTAQGTRVGELIEEGKTTVISLKGVPPDIQELVVERVATALFELRKMGKVPPLMLVVEEAHNYCPQQGQAASSKIFRTIASEGRKFGLGLTIITQRAAKVDKNVLSQCNTQIILKVTNPNDLKAITSSVEGLTSGMADEIQRLPIGVAIVTGGGLGMPLFVEVRPRETMHGGDAVEVV
ncbi:MAG: ATP-binding protein [Thermoplasmata archaeon]|nr:ATP-binding protein [Thermoplasmata archaeon]